MQARYSEVPRAMALMYNNEAKTVSAAWSRHLQLSWETKGRWEDSDAVPVHLGHPVTFFLKPSTVTRAFAFSPKRLSVEIREIGYRTQTQGWS